MAAVVLELSVFPCWSPAHLLNRWTRCHHHETFTLHLTPSIEWLPFGWHLLQPVQFQYSYIYFLPHMRPSWQNPIWSEEGIFHYNGQFGNYGDSGFHRPLQHVQHVRWGAGTWKHLRGVATAALWPLPQQPNGSLEGGASEKGGAKLLLVLAAICFSSFTSCDITTSPRPSSRGPPHRHASRCLRFSLNKRLRQQGGRGERGGGWWWRSLHLLLLGGGVQVSRGCRGRGGEGGSCSVPGSICEEESRVSVSEVLVYRD